MRNPRAGNPASQTKKYFFSILLLFSLVSLCLVTLSTAYFSSKITDLMTDAFSERHQRSIDQLSYLFDNLHAQLIPGLKESSYNNFSYSDLMYSYKIDPYEIKQGLDDLDDLLLTYPLIQSIYLYNGQMNFFLTTTSGLEDADTFYDREVLTILNNFDSNFIDYYWPRTACYPESPYFNNILVEKPTLTLLMGTTPSQKTQLKGALIVNLDMDAVTALLQSESLNSDDVIFIYNQRGEFITKNGEISREEMDSIYRKIREGDGEEGLIFDKDRIIAYKRNFRLGWYFTGIMPLESITSEINQVRRAIIIVMCLLITLAILFSYLSARYIYSPISKLMNFILKEDDADCYLIEKNNEISHIQHQYIQVLSKKNALEDSLQNLNNDYRIEIFRSLLDGNQYHFWIDELQPRDQALLKGTLELYLFQIDDYYDRCIKMDTARFRRIRMDLLEEIRSRLDDEGEMLVDMSSRNLVCLTGKEGSFDRMAELHRELIAEMPLSLSLGCASRTLENPNDLHDLYREAVDRVGGKFLTGYGKIHRDSNPEPTEPILPARYMDRFFSALLMADREKCDEKFKKIIAFLKEGTFRNYRQFINLFSYRFLVLLKDQKDSPLIPRLLYTRNHPQILETLDSFTFFFSEIITSIIEEKSRTNQKSLSHFKQIDETVKASFKDPSFCVQSLSQTTGFSPNHLRKIYKAFSQESLSDAINNLRLEEACRLLVETDDPVKEIFEPAGFTNYNSFFSSFKKYTGRTPALYRSKNKTTE